MLRLSEAKCDRKTAPFYFTKIITLTDTNSSNLYYIQYERYPKLYLKHFCDIMCVSLLRDVRILPRQMVVINRIGATEYDIKLNVLKNNF